MSHWMVEALFASSLLMLLVLLIRKPVAAQFGPRMGYWLWLLPALRMVMPPLPSSWSLRPVEALPGDALPVALFDVQPDLAVAASDLAQGAMHWAEIALIVWAVGAVLHFALHLWAYRRFWLRAMQGATLIQTIDPGPIEVLTTDEVSGPLAMGLRKPAILVPSDFEERYDAKERAFAIAHELAHHRRGDLMVNVGALAMLSLHWFNPLAHAAYRAFRTDQELACDATIMANADGEDRHAYACALVKSACDRAPMVTCSLNRKQELKQRLRMMRFGQLSAARGAVASGLGFALLAGGLLATASVGASAAADTQVGRMVQDGITSGGAVVADAVMPDEAEVRAAEAEARIGEKEAAIGEAESRLGEEEAALAQAAAKSRVTAKSDAATAQASTQEASEAAQEAAEAARDAIEAKREALADAREALEERREALMDAREAERDAMQAIHEAEREAQEAIREGNEKARRATREALAEARRTMRETMRSAWHAAPAVPPVPPVPPVEATPPVPPVPPVPHACNGRHGKHETHVTISRNGKHREVHVVQDCPKRQVSMSEIERAAIAALYAARRQVGQLSQLSELEKLAALKSIDAQLAHLRTRLN